MVAGVDDLRAKLTRRSRALLSGIVAGCLTAACDGAPAVPVAQASALDSLARTERQRARLDSVVRSRPGYVIDSILPIEEDIRRFQAAAGPAPASFSHGASSRAELVEAFVRALERNDTTSLVRLVVDRAEFAYLIYPTSPNASPPYRQSPQLVWLTRSASTQKSLTRLSARFGGKPLSYAGYSCATPAARHGVNRVWADCIVRSGENSPTPLRMFGPIVEHNGRFKFLSLTNGL